MTPAEWLTIGGIVIAALDQILHVSPLKSNNLLQLIINVMKVIIRGR